MFCCLKLDLSTSGSTAAVRNLERDRVAGDVAELTPKSPSANFAQLQDMIGFLFTIGIMRTVHMRSLGVSPQ